MNSSLRRLYALTEEIAPEISDRLDRVLLAGRRDKGEGFEVFLKKNGISRTIIDYVREFDCHPKMKKWLAFKLKDYMRGEGPSRMNAILTGLGDSMISLRDWADYHLRRPGFNLDAYPDLDHAFEAASDWHENLARESADKGHPSLYQQRLGEDLGNGFTMVEVPLQDLKNEGNLMGHCVGQGSYDRGVADGTTRIFSVRDSRGEPHVTIEVSFEENEIEPADDDREYADYYGREREIASKGEIQQIQGKEDKPPIDAYRPPLKEWFVRHDGELFDVSNGDWLQVTPEPELLDLLIKNRAIDSSYRQIICKLTDESSEMVYDRILADLGEGWCDFAVTQTLWRRSPDLRPGMSEEQKTQFEEMFSRAVESPRDKIRSNAIRILAERTVPVDGEMVAYRYSPEGLEHFSGLLATDDSPKVIGSIIGTYAASVPAGDSGNWTRPPLPPEIAAVIPSVIPRLLGTDPHLGDNRDLMYHIEELISRGSMDLVPDYLAAMRGRQYATYNSPFDYSLIRSFTDLYSRNPGEFSELLSRMEEGDKKELLSGLQMNGIYSRDDRYSTTVATYRDGLERGWLSPRDVPPNLVEWVWPRDGSYGVPPWMEGEDLS